MLFNRRIVAIPLMLVVSFLVASTSSFAQAVIWAGGNGPWFSNPSNWSLSIGGSPFLPPNGPGITANIGTASGLGPITGTVTLNGPVNLPYGISLGNGAAGGLIVNSAANTLTAGTMDVGFSGPGTSTLAISNGGVVNGSYVYFGATTGSSGSATVSGAGSQWNVSTQFLVGDNGQGALSIQTGGAVSTSNAIVGAFSGSSGSASVSGAGAKWTDSGALTIGASGSGHLTIQSGGSVSSAQGNIGTGASSGSVLVTGAGSQWAVTGTFLDVGFGGSGSLTIQNGATVNITNSTGGLGTGFIGTNGGTGAVTVAGAGSQWNMDSLEVGSGNGSLNIQNGGLVNAGSTFIGTFGGSSGTATVSGANSQLIGYQLDVGYEGQGTLAITAGGQVNDVIGFVGAVSGSTGNVLVDAGTWTNSDLLDIGVNGTGGVTVEDGGDLSAGSIEVGGNGILNIDPATVDVSGNFTLDANGILSLDIAGITPGLFSQLDISSFGLFHGTIDFHFIDGFAPTTGESFDLINALGADFSDATIQIEGLEPGFQYTGTFADGHFTLVADNNGVSSSTPEPSSLWLVATALAVFALAGLRRNLKSRSEPVQGLV